MCTSLICDYEVNLEKNKKDWQAVKWNDWSRASLVKIIFDAFYLPSLYQHMIVLSLFEDFEHSFQQIEGSDLAVPP